MMPRLFCILEVNIMRQKIRGIFNKIRSGFKKLFNPDIQFGELERSFSVGTSQESQKKEPEDRYDTDGHKLARIYTTDGEDITALLNLNWYHSEIAVLTEEAMEEFGLRRK